MKNLKRIVASLLSVLMVLSCCTALLSLVAFAEDTVLVSRGKSYTITGCGKGYNQYDTSLTDGVAKETLTYGADEWFGFYYNKDAAADVVSAPNGIGSAVIDLGEVVEGIDRLRAHLCNESSAGIAAPKSLKASVSENGTDYTEVGSFELQSSGKYWAELNLDNAVSARYVKFTFELTGVFAFVNELEVYGIGEEPEPVPVTVNAGYNYKYDAGVTTLSSWKMGATFGDIKDKTHAWWNLAVLAWDAEAGVYKVTDVLLGNGTTSDFRSVAIPEYGFLLGAHNTSTEYGAVASLKVGDVVYIYGEDLLNETQETAITATVTTAADESKTAFAPEIPVTVTANYNFNYAAGDITTLTPWTMGTTLESILDKQYEWFNFAVLAWDADAGVYKVTGVYEGTNSKADCDFGPLEIPEYGFILGAHDQAVANHDAVVSLKVGDVVYIYGEDLLNTTQGTAINATVTTVADESKTAFAPEIVPAVTPITITANYNFHYVADDVTTLTPWTMGSTLESILDKQFEWFNYAILAWDAAEGVYKVTGVYEGTNSKADCDFGPLEIPEYGFILGAHDQAVANHDAILELNVGDVVYIYGENLLSTDLDTAITAIVTTVADESKTAFAPEIEAPSIELVEGVNVVTLPVGDVETTTNFDKDLVLTIENAGGITVTVNGTVYTIGMLGTLEAALPAGENTVVITNANEAAVEAVINIVAPAVSVPGDSIDNPIVITELGDITADVTENHVEGVYYEYTSTINGELTITINTESDWFYYINNETAGKYGDFHFGDVASETIKVSVGDKITFCVSTDDGVSSPVGTVDFTLTANEIEAPDQEVIVVDGKLNDSGWKADGWITVNKDNGEFQGGIDALKIDESKDFTYKFQMRTEGGKLYVAAVYYDITCADSATKVRLWLKTNPEATVYTHFYDLYLVNGVATTLAKYNTSTTANSGANIADSSVEGAISIIDGNVVFELSVDLAEFGGEDGFAYFFNGGHNNGENIQLLYPAVETPEEGNKLVNFPYNTWSTANEATADPAALKLGAVAASTNPSIELVEGENNVTLPAGDAEATTNFENDLVLSIENASGITVIINSVEYTVGMLGNITATLPAGENAIIINNASDAAVDLVINIAAPVVIVPGDSVENPIEITELGDITADVTENHVEGVYYEYTSTINGELTITINSESDWFYFINNETSGVYGDWHISDGVSETIKVSVGDKITFCVGTGDGWDIPVGTVEFNLTAKEIYEIRVGSVNAYGWGGDGYPVILGYGDGKTVATTIGGDWFTWWYKVKAEWNEDEKAFIVNAVDGTNSTVYTGWTFNANEIVMIAYPGAESQYPSDKDAVAGLKIGDKLYATGFDFTNISANNLIVDGVSSVTFSNVEAGAETPVHQIELIEGDNVLFIPAGDSEATVNFDKDLVLTIANASGITVTVNGTVYTIGMLGTLEAILPAGENTVVINNGSDEVIEVAINIAAPAVSVPGDSAENPIEITELGDITADVTDKHVEGVFYVYTSTIDGELTITIKTESGWFYQINNETAGIYGDAHYGEGASETIKVSVGDKITIVVSTDDGSFVSPVGTVDFNLEAKEAVTSITVTANYNFHYAAGDVTTLTPWTMGSTLESILDKQYEWFNFAVLAWDADAGVYKVIGVYEGTNDKADCDFGTLEIPEYGFILGAHNDAVANHDAILGLKVGDVVYIYGEDLLSTDKDKEITAVVTTVAEEGKTAFAPVIEVPFILGDIDGDGEVTALDYALAKRHVLKTYTLEGDEFKAADLDGDGVITAREYGLIKRHVLKTFDLADLNA